LQAFFQSAQHIYEKREVFGSVTMTKMDGSESGRPKNTCGSCGSGSGFPTPESGPSLTPTEQGDGGGPDGGVCVGQPLLDTLEGGARLQPPKPEHLDPLRRPAQRLRLHHGAEKAEDIEIFKNHTKKYNTRTQRRITNDNRKAGGKVRKTSHSDKLLKVTTG
jgi:hypothetical protein